MCSPMPCPDLLYDILRPPRVSTSAAHYCESGAWRRSEKALNNCIEHTFRVLTSRCLSELLSSLLEDRQLLNQHLSCSDLAQEGEASPSTFLLWGSFRFSEMNRRGIAQEILLLVSPFYHFIKGILCLPLSSSN